MGVALALMLSFNLLLDFLLAGFDTFLEVEGLLLELVLL